MSGRAEVLAAHWFSPMDYAYCLCGADMSPIQPVGIHQALAAHQAAMLTAAGFGAVKEAGAVALGEAAAGMREERRMWCLDDAGRYWIKRTLDDLEERADAIRADQ